MPLSVHSGDETDDDGDHELMYGHGPLTEEELNEKYPGRPKNKRKTPPFHQLVNSLFIPLTENKAKVGGPASNSRKKGHGSNTMTPHERRKNIIEQFVSRWRSEVGKDFYPAIRLILPSRDRDRPMYGLKEKSIGKLVVKMVGLNSRSEDAMNLTDWKRINSASKNAGDFAGRCYEVLSKRSMRTQVGNMRIAEVNALLDQLAAVSKEADQLPLFEKFYSRMNAEELMWLIRIILRQMKIGATEKTVLDVWHPDGDALFNVSSSLRRVCWELVDPNIDLGTEDKGIQIMSCFQPQLAQFQSHSFPVMLAKMQLEEDAEGTNTFWIEEKLDGERMQMHMDTGPDGKRRFAWYSRKATDYTYLYGSSHDDDNSALARFIDGAFKKKVRNIILDGEMITWNMDADKVVAFGTLKTAAKSERNNPYQADTGNRPLFRVFDCLYLNHKPITMYTLRERYRALESSIQNVNRRLEIHTHATASELGGQEAIEEQLRDVIDKGHEGLVLKNPNSAYSLNERNNMWMKVKPEYMTEFGESLDLIVIGGYYGGGHRGGKLASFLCGLRVNQDQIARGSNPMKCFSFCKVGGGFRGEDYAKIYHQTDGKWIPWNDMRPPKEYIRLGGGEKQYEKPDVWIKPCDSIVLEVKAASVGVSDRFGTKYTLRFPRFRRLKDEKSWEQALSMDEFDEVKQNAEEESKTKEIKVENRRKTKRLKKEYRIAGNDSKIKTPYAGPKTKIFEGLNFCVMNESQQAPKRTKAETEQAIKGNGGNIFQTPGAAPNMICIGDKRVVKVASLIKMGQKNVVKPAWVFDAMQQAEADGLGKGRYLLPFEPAHMFHIAGGFSDEIAGSVDVYGDSYARDTNPEDLKALVDDMIHPKNSSFSVEEFLLQLDEHGKGLQDTPGSMFARCVVRFVSSDMGGAKTMANIDHLIIQNQFRFAAGRISDNDDDESITHYVLLDQDEDLISSLRKRVVQLTRRPRIVDINWLKDSWEEKTLLDEERYAL
ncbi:uncharacterized protein L3040_004326 [Drepanopeziza brunnea f. sp. 'multigermtubi']|uniref:DNA ligase n=1 Tax=Marssonina brunnea f. sp. multigermtubi (strain MB_m1) TaxID=1072389 RepID=K1X5G3_MARBU|nr:DNA ligase [Drepanopeziza brunnea f. sp. 'multigermtubi' MB_m1]EKD20386.1 DNA ligase [Drepanopeziza brunnea f. sp. 'multigermtubi' MB_m1]KAJ5042936.1 hypothetical protein L3040_004326 [Drepanopeziza brunnea f. sp. 'multigermtubi']